MLIMSLHVNFIIIYREFIQVFFSHLYKFLGSVELKKLLGFCFFFLKILRHLLVMTITIAIIIRIVEGGNLNLKC